MADIVVAPVEDIPPGEVKIVRAGELAIGIYNLDGTFYAIEDRCSHDDGPLCEGEFEAEEGVAICPRHGARIEICTGRPLSFPFSTVPTNRSTRAKRGKPDSCGSVRRRK